jgi:hypothetical protein
VAQLQQIVDLVVVQDEQLEQLGLVADRGEMLRRRGI